MNRLIKLANKLEKKIAEYTDFTKLQPMYESALYLNEIKKVKSAADALFAYGVEAIRKARPDPYETVPYDLAKESIIQIKKESTELYNIANTVGITSNISNNYKSSLMNLIDRLFEIINDKKNPIYDDNLVKVASSFKQIINSFAPGTVVRKPLKPAPVPKEEKDKPSFGPPTPPTGVGLAASPGREYLEAEESERKRLEQEQRPFGSFQGLTFREPTK